MRVAAIDIGSHTILLLIAVVHQNKIKEVVCEESEFVRLGEGVHKNKKLSLSALTRAKSCLARYSFLIAQHAVNKVVAVATSATREAKNKEDLVAVGRRLGLSISVISGDMEAYLTYKGSTFDLEGSECVVVDVGGGSTEVIGKNQAGEMCGCSVDVGSVRLTEMFVCQDLVSDDEIQGIDAYIHQCLLKKKDQIPFAKKVVAVAGTPITLAAVVQGVDFSEELIHGYRLTLEQMTYCRQAMAQQTLEMRKKTKGMSSDRADVIVAGTSILKNFVEYLGVNEVCVSTKGIRYGVALSTDLF